MRPIHRGISLGLLVLSACAPPLPPPDLRPVVTLDEEIDVGTGDLSPDGRYLSEIDWDTGDLRLVDLRTGEGEGLTGDGYGGGGYAWTSAFSPDGSRVAAAWYRDAPGTHELRLIDRESGEARVLVPASDTVSYLDPLGWAPAGDRVLVAVRGAEPIWSLAWVAVADGAVDRLTTLSWLAPGGEQTYPRAHVSPDGRFVAYDYRADPDAAERDVFVLPAEGGEAWPLAPGPGTDRVLGWFPDGSGILLYSDRGGSPGVWSVPVRDGRAAGRPRRVRSLEEGWIRIGMAPEGYLFGRVAESERIHTAEIDPVAGRVIAPATAPDPPTRLSLAGDWSPDGSRLVYATQDPLPRGTESLVVRTAEGDLVREVTLPPAFHTSTGTLRWVEENQIILFGSERGRFGVHRMDPRDGRSTRLPVSGEGLEGGNLKWVEPSPDGRTLYLFRPNRPGGGNELLAIDAATGEQRSLGVFPADPRALAVSPDGRELALIVRDRPSRTTELRVIPAGGGAGRAVLRSEPGQPFTTPVAWTPDGARLLYGRPGPNGSRVLWSVAADGAGEPTRIGGEDWCCRGHDLRFHPDGRRIVLPAGGDRLEVWLMPLGGGAPR